MSERNSQVENAKGSQMDATGGVKVVPSQAGKRPGRVSAASLHSSNAAARLASPLRVTGIDTNKIGKNKDDSSINRQTSTTVLV